MTAAADVDDSKKTKASSTLATIVPVNGVYSRQSGRGLKLTKKLTSCQFIIIIIMLV